MVNDIISRLYPRFRRIRCWSTVGSPKKIQQLRFIEGKIRYTNLDVTLLDETAELLQNKKTIE